MEQKVPNNLYIYISYRATKMQNYLTEPPKLIYSNLAAFIRN